MRSFCRGWSLIQRQTLTHNASNISHLRFTRASDLASSSHGLSSLSSHSSVPNGHLYLSRAFQQFASCPPLPLLTKFGSQTEMVTFFNRNSGSPRHSLSRWVAAGPPFPNRSMATAGNSVNSEPLSQDSSAVLPPRIKFKRLDKTARHIMQILDREAVGQVREQREIPDIKPGYIVQLKVEAPENKRRVSTFQGIVIARRNAGLNTTFRIRRQVASVGVESLFLLYSPNIKEIKVLDKTRKVRRAKLYYLRDRPNALKKR